MAERKKSGPVVPKVQGSTPFERQLPTDPLYTFCGVPRASAAVGSWQTRVGTVVHLPALPDWMGIGKKQK